MPENEGERSISRRDVLRSTAATGIASLGLTSGAVADAAGQEDVAEYGMEQDIQHSGDRTVRITARNGVQANYEFEVTGLLSASGAPGANANDGVASGTVSGGTHEFRFSGEFTQFNIDGAGRVTVDGKAFDPAAFPRHRLEIAPRGTVEFDVSASGAVSVDGARAEQPTARRAIGTADDTVVVAYEGELTYLDIDGNASLRKNGRAVEDAGAALPSTHPHVARVQSDGGRETYQFRSTNDVGVVSSGNDEAVDERTVSGQAVGAPTEFRYAGRATRFERNDGATMEFDERTKRVRCRAPADTAVDFGMESTEGFARDGELRREPTVTVAAGETTEIKYFGQITGGTIGRLSVALDLSVYPEATDSARLQHAAQIERHEAFAVLTEDAEQYGRVRYDANAFAGIEVNPEETAGSFAVGTFALTDLNRGEKANVRLSVDDDGSIRAARNEYRQFSNGSLDVFEADRYDPESDAQALTTESFDVNLPETASATTTPETSDVEVSPEGFFDDIFDQLGDFVSGIAGITTQIAKNLIESTIENSTSISFEDIVVKSTEIVCGTLAAIEELFKQTLEKADEAYDYAKYGKFIMKAAMSGFVGAGMLIGTDIVEQAKQDHWGCAGCIFAIAFLFEVVCGRVSQAIGCAVISWPSAGLGGLGCVIVLEAACSAIQLALPSAEDICSDVSAPIGLDVCT